MADTKIIIGLLFILGAAAILYYLWRKTEQELSLPVIPEKLSWYSPLLSNPFSRWKIQRLAAERKHKQQYHRQYEFLVEHGLEPKKILLPHQLEKLHQLISQHQRSTLWRQLTAGERTAFERLEEIITGVPQVRPVPQFRRKKSTPPSLRMTTRQQQDIFSILRKIAGQK